MSTQAPDTSGRPSSSRYSTGSYSQKMEPYRSQSAAHRPQSIPPSPLRSNSYSQAHSRPPSSSRQASNLASVARKDVEQMNLAQPSPSRRSSMDRQSDIFASDPQSDIPPQASNQRVASRSGPSRYSSDLPSAPSSNGARPDSRDLSGKILATTGISGNVGSAAVRKRTTIVMKTGEWTLGKTIGAGSMGKVKLAKNLATGEQGAIKIVPRYSTDEHRTQQERERADASKEVRTQREAAIVTLVNHPYICGMRDVHRTNYHWYMVFEYVNGGQMLDYIISHGRLKEKQARKFGRQIASALDYSHRNSIVHRDLKIENILISKDGNIKIIDFGLSNLFSPRSTLKTFCGSLYFAAPELLQARAYTGPEVDIWSFGIVLYVLVCGKVPFDDQSMPQLHAKIKKGLVEYPPWLTNECKHIISRMLVTDPKARAPLSEIMSHPWMVKGSNGPPENCLPTREPLQLPLDDKIIEKMTGFDFGSVDDIKRELQGILTSEDYLRAVRSAARRPQAAGEVERKKVSVFDFYQRRKSASSKDTLTAPSNEAVHLGEDPINAFSPLISIYYLAREKQEREQRELNPGALAMPQSPGEKPIQLPDLPAPEPAVTNTATFEMTGEIPTGGRSRPRARTQGEDEVELVMQKESQEIQTPRIVSPAFEATPFKRESAAIGLIRRFSTRRGRDSVRQAEREKDLGEQSTSTTPSIRETSLVPPRSSFSVRKTRDRDTPPSAYKNVAHTQPGLLAPPNPSDGATSRLKGLGRSTSVNSGDMRRRWSTRRGTSENFALKPDATIEAEKVSLADSNNVTGDGSEEEGRASSVRARSTGHSRPISFAKRQSRVGTGIDSEVPEETDQELAEDAEGEPGAFTTSNRSQETMKPVYLKGLFSVSTTSNKPLMFIRADIIRVLKQLGVEYREIRGGFSCRHVPSIDLNKIVDNPQWSEETRSSKQNIQHRRKFSFAGIRGPDTHNEKELAPSDPMHSLSRTPATPRTPSRRPAPDSYYTTEEEASDEDANQRVTQNVSQYVPRAAGETTTHVQSDLGQSMVLRFEVLVVKVPFLSLHGLQFKKLDGGTWQYKKMAENILALLKL